MLRHRLSNFKYKNLPPLFLLKVNIVKARDPLRSTSRRKKAKTMKKTKSSLMMYLTNSLINKEPLNPILILMREKARMTYRNKNLILMLLIWTMEEQKNHSRRNLYPQRKNT